jgi:CrcB protein
MKLLLIGAGGALGSVARFLLASAVQRLAPGELALGTLAVNVLGSFAMGFVVAWSLARGSFEAETRAILTAGVLGGFTTYSSFNQEALELWNRGASGWLALHVGMTVVGCLVAGALGGALGRAAATP